MFIYTALKIATIVLVVMLIVSSITFGLWFYAEKRVCKYGKSLLYTTKKRQSVRGELWIL